MTTAISRKRLTITTRALCGMLAAVALLLGALNTSALLPRSRAALDLNGVTTGPLLRLADLLGIHSVSIPGVPVVGDVNINLAYTGQDPANLYNAVNGFPFGGFLLGNFYRQPGGSLGTAILASSGIAVGNAVKAYEALLASAGGHTPAGYTPLTASGKVNTLTGASCTSGITCIQGTNVTNLAALFVNDPGTPNGGLYTRFGSILNLFGLNPITPGGQSASSTGVRVNAATVGIGWGYSLMSDFPATLNPFSLVNSLLATVLPTNLLGGVTLGGASTTDIGTNLGLLATLGTPTTTYSTLVPNDLPLLEPLRLPSRIINFVLGKLGVQAKLGTPLANALQPALSILVNLGYTDVVLPRQGGTYNRSYTDQGTYTQFMSQGILTPKQWLFQVPGDIIRALIVGFQDQFPILRFGRPAPTLVPDGDHLAISYGSSSVAGTGATPASTTKSAVAAVKPVAPPAKPVAAAAVTNPPKSVAKSVAASPVSGSAAGATGVKAKADHKAQSLTDGRDADRQGPSSGPKGSAAGHGPTGSDK
ncbi:MAG: PE-PPE domain-containing protein [Mycobacterium sp.]